MVILLTLACCFLAEILACALERYLEHRAYVSSQPPYVITSRIENGERIVTVRFGGSFDKKQHTEQMYDDFMAELRKPQNG